MELDWEDPTYIILKIWKVKKSTRYWDSIWTGNKIFQKHSMKWIRF